MLVLPTLWSPKKTSLYLASGAKDAAAGLACPETTDEREMTEEEEVAEVMAGRDAGLVSAVVIVWSVAPVGAYDAILSIIIIIII